MAVAEIEYDWSAVTEEFPLVLVLMELYWLLIFLREGSLFEYEGLIPLGGLPSLPLVFERNVSM